MTKEALKKPVVISNELTRAAYTLSLNEKRLIMFAVSTLDCEADELGLIEFRALDCARFYSMAESSARRELKKAVDTLWMRELVTSDGTGHRWIISRGKYEDGALKIRFHPDLEPHLIGLKERFTRYYLKHAADFKHTSTWRIFEMIMQFKNKGYVIFKLDDFKTALDITGAYENRIADLRRKVITPALKEINTAYGGALQLTCDSKRTGRKVTHLEFKFNTEPQMQLHLETEQADKGKPAIKKLIIDAKYIDKYVSANPETTRGKTYEQIAKMIKSEYPNSAIKL